MPVLDVALALTSDALTLRKRLRQNGSTHRTVGQSCVTCRVGLDTEIAVAVSATKKARPQGWRRRAKPLS